MDAPILQMLHGRSEVFGHRPAPTRCGGKSFDNEEIVLCGGIDKVLLSGCL